MINGRILIMAPGIAHTVSTAIESSRIYWLCNWKLPRTDALVYWIDIPNGIRRVQWIFRVPVHMLRLCVCGCVNAVAAMLLSLHIYKFASKKLSWSINLCHTHSIIAYTRIIACDLVFDTIEFIAAHPIMGLCEFDYEDNMEIISDEWHSVWRAWLR